VNRGCRISGWRLQRLRVVIAVTMLLYGSELGVNCSIFGCRLRWMRVAILDPLHSSEDVKLGDRCRSGDQRRLASRIESREKKTSPVKKPDVAVMKPFNGSGAYFNSPNITAGNDT
jgi:hypothetical protein